MSATRRALGRHKPTFVFLAILIAINLAWRPIMLWYDTHFPGAPWLVATVEVVDHDSLGQPILAYQARARFEVSGVWTATVYTGGPTAPRRASTTHGDGTYVPGRELREWTWFAFFQGHQGAAGVPPIPDEPYQVCVSYRVEALRSGAYWATPSNLRDCTDWQYPNED